MSGATYQSPTAAYVDATGIHAPDFVTIRDYLVSQFQIIYGEDIVVTADSQDGQLLSVFALAIADVNAACIHAYNAYSPSTAQGAGLSSMVKINGMTRAMPSYSAVALVLDGVAGTVIRNGIAADSGSNKWALPEAVVIPPSGRVTVTATAVAAGDVMALPNTITRISTVTRGWQSVNNPGPASPGAPVEDDAALRFRQTQSTAMPSRTVLSGIVGAVLAVPGVLAAKPYENDTNITQPVTNLPPHSIALVVIGGNVQDICDTILMHKTPGCYTFGTTRAIVFDSYQLPHDIGYFIPMPRAIQVEVTLRARINYTSQIGRVIAASVADYINALGSGEWVVWSKLWLPANLCDAQGLPVGTISDAYDIQSLTVGASPGVPATNNIPIDIFEIATCDAKDVTIVVAP